MNSEMKLEGTTNPPPATGLSALTMSKALFLVAAGMSFLLSVFLFFRGQREHGIFVAVWVPSILSAGTLLTGGRNHE